MTEPDNEEMNELIRGRPGGRRVEALTGRLVGADTEPEPELPDTTAPDRAQEENPNDDR